MKGKCKAVSALVAIWWLNALFHSLSLTFPLDCSLAESHFRSLVTTLHDRCWVYRCWLAGRCLMLL